MFERTTLSLPELAARWGRTPKQILEFAQNLGVPLYFNYGCLAFEETDSWHRSAGDQWEVQERDRLTKAIASTEGQIIRARDGQLSQWEQLPSGGAPELRAEISAMKGKLKFIDELLEQREIERAQCELGFLRAGPGTLLDIANNGEVKFPRWAFHTADPISASVIYDERGNPFLEWAGRIMILEARSDGDPRWSRMLSADDLFASMADVKAIEARQAQQEQVNAPVDGHPAPAIEERDSGASDTEVEKMKKAALIKRFVHQWPSLESDIGEASRNGLALARLSGGFYDVGKAIKWAKEKGKFNESSAFGGAINSILNSPTSVKKTLK
jgi:hypothetical protein